MKSFLFVTGALLAACVSSLICQLMYTAREQFAPSEASISGGLGFFLLEDFGVGLCVETARSAYGV